MAEKARLFHDHRLLEFILNTSEPQSHKRIGRSVWGFDNDVWERQRVNTFLARTFPKCLQNPEMKHHRLGTGNKYLAAASPFDQEWGIGFREDDLDARDPHLWRAKNCSGRLFLPSAASFATI